MSVLGMVEYKTIATGIKATDAMVKAASVELLESRPITPGRYMSLVTGEVASVEASVNAGVSTAGTEAVTQSFVLANLHEQILPAIRGKLPVPQSDAVGVVETSNPTATVLAADAACKTAPVQLIRLHLALHIGGKGYMIFVGDVADVEASEQAGCRLAGAALVDHVVIPNPYDEIYDYLHKKHEW